MKNLINIIDKNNRKDLFFLTNDNRTFKHHRKFQHKIKNGKKVYRRRYGSPIEYYCALLLDYPLTHPNWKNVSKNKKQWGKIDIKYTFSINWHDHIYVSTLFCKKQKNWSFDDFTWGNRVINDNFTFSPNNKYCDNCGTNVFYIDINKIIYTCDNCGKQVIEKDLKTSKDNLVKIRRNYKLSKL